MLAKRDEGPTLSKWKEFLDSDIAESDTLAGVCDTPQSLKEYAGGSHTSGGTSRSDILEKRGAAGSPPS
jgi:hypothetical protein